MGGIGFDRLLLRNRLLLIDFFFGGEMILTTIKLHGQATKRKEIIQTLCELANRMENEQGFLKAELFQDTDRQDTLYFMEEWQSRRDFEKHQKSRSLAVLLGLETLLTEPLVIKHSVKVSLK